MNNSVVIIMIGIALLIFGLLYQTHRLYELQSQITVLQIQSKEQTVRFDIAKQHADDQMRRVQDESQEILKTEVSGNCEAAIKWGLEKARELQ